MLSSDRRKFLALISTPLALSACGFQPIYGKDSAAARMHGRITLGPVGNLNGFQMREYLETRLGAASNPTHALEVSLSTNRKGLAITQDGAITRYNLSGEAKFSVQKIGGTVVLRDSVQTFTAYNATASAYATRVAQKDAYRRLVESLADKILTAMAISAQGWLS